MLEQFDKIAGAGPEESAFVANYVARTCALSLGAMAEFAIPIFCLLFFFSSRRRHTRSKRDWSSDVCSSDLVSRRTRRQRARRRSCDLQLRGGRGTLTRPLVKPNPGLTTPRVGGRAKWPSHFGRDQCAMLFLIRLTRLDVSCPRPAALRAPLV